MFFLILFNKHFLLLNFSLDCAAIYRDQKIQCVIYVRTAKFMNYNPRIYKLNKIDRFFNDFKTNICKYKVS